MISPDPLVTIVTPSYNQGRFIKATIESVLTQDYPFVEYIIMDGGSTDETAEVAAPYAGRLTFISERDRGQTHAVNKGFAMANGEIVAWLNSDDVFLPGAIRHAVDAFRANPHYGVVYGEGFQILEDGSIRQHFPYTQRFDLWKLVYTSDYILNQSAFFRKAALDAVGPLREELYYIMDWEILMRLGLYFEFGHVQHDLGCLREYGEAKTFTGGLKRAREIKRILTEYTGQQFPPGTIVYGLDTYKQYWLAKIEKWPEWASGFKDLASRVVKRIVHKVIWAATQRGQAWFRDKWLGPSAYIMLPQGQGDVVMRGKVPDVPGLQTQVVRILYKRKRIAEFSLHPGPFELRFTLPLTYEQTPIFNIRSSRKFCFGKLDPESEDTRTLSLLLDAVGWAKDN